MRLLLVWTNQCLSCSLKLEKWNRWERKRRAKWRISGWGKSAFTISTTFSITPFSRYEISRLSASFYQSTYRFLTKKHNNLRVLSWTGYEEETRHSVMEWTRGQCRKSIRHYTLVMRWSRSRTGILREGYIRARGRFYTSIPVIRGVITLHEYTIISILTLASIRLFNWLFMLFITRLRQRGYVIY